MKCGCCSANIKAGSARRGGSSGRRVQVGFYECSWHRNRGRTVCDNSKRLRVEEADSAVLAVVEGMLTPDVVDRIIERAVQIVAQQRNQPERSRQLQAELKRDRKQLENFLATTANGSAPKSVLAEIARFEAHISELEEQLAETPATAELDLRRLRRAAAEQMAKFRDLVRADVPLARQALRKLLPEPVEFVPVEDGIELRGKLSAGAVFTACLAVASPRGIVPQARQVDVPFSLRLAA